MYTNNTFRRTDFVTVLNRTEWNSSNWFVARVSLLRPWTMQWSDAFLPHSNLDDSVLDLSPKYHQFCESKIPPPRILSLPLIDASPSRVSGAVDVLGWIKNLASPNPDDEPLGVPSASNRTILSADLGMMIRCLQAKRRRLCDVFDDFDSFEFLFGLCLHILTSFDFDVVGGLHLHFMVASAVFSSGELFGIQSIAEKLGVDSKVNGSAKDSFESHENFFEALTVALLKFASTACSAKENRPVTVHDVFEFLV